MRGISEQGLALIKRFEGFSKIPYRCPAGYPTIGYGHLIRKNEIFPPEGINAEQAEALLQKDIRQAEQVVCRLIPVPLTEGQYAALVSFTYNLGGAVLQRSTLRRKVNRRQHAVKQEFMKYIWANGHKLPGLVARRAAEAALYVSDFKPPLLS